MEKRDKIIIVSLVIFIIVLAGIIIYMFNGQQQPTQIKVVGNKTIEEGEVLKVKLSSLNGTGIKNKKIHIVIMDYKNKEVLNKTVTTNSKGKAQVALDDISKGKYVVNITFEGDKNYSANTTSQKIIIIEKKVVEATPEVTQTTASPQQNEESTDDLGLSQHKASDWEYVGTSVDGEHYSDGRGGELVMHEDGQYEYYDGHGNVVGGLIE